MKSIALAGFAALAFVAALAASGSRVAAQMAPTPTPMPAADFAHTAWLTNQQEVVDARYVISQTKDPDVRRFAQGMIDDHTTANVELRSAARSSGVAVPTLEPPVSTGIKALTGKSLDGTYMQAQVDGHWIALTLLQNEGAYGAPPAFRNYASNWSGIVSNHLSSAIAYVTLKQQGLPTTTMPNPSSRVGQ